jgi:hypothetical protein
MPSCAPYPSLPRRERAAGPGRPNRSSC